MFWYCPSCGGRAEGVGLLRQSTSHEFLSQLWASAREGNGIRRRPCPACGKLMIDVGSPVTETLDVEVCTTCELVWFDANEYEAIPVVIQQSEPKPLASPQILATRPTRNWMELDDLAVPLAKLMGDRYKKLTRIVLGITSNIKWVLLLIFLGVAVWRITRVLIEVFHARPTF